MRGDEAVNLLKEASDTCPTLGKYGVALMPPDAEDVLSHGFQIHAIGIANEATDVCLHTLIDRKNLRLKLLQERNILFIYRPIT
ncbi:MAG: hypothetical protein IAX22_08930 [Candidatus Bathyarchaeota archaeon]|nr:hypothetical protein [Candidatus Bathyarchaeota archaeon]